MSVILLSLSGTQIASFLSSMLLSSVSSLAVPHFSTLPKNAKIFGGGGGGKKKKNFFFILF